MNDAVNQSTGERADAESESRRLLPILEPGDQLTPLAGRFRRGDLERVFLRDNLRTTRQYLVILAVAGIAGGVMSGFAASVSLPADSFAYRAGLALRVLLVGTAVGAVLLLDRARQPWQLFSLNAVVLTLGLLVVSLRMSEPLSSPPDTWSLFHVTRDGMTVLLFVSLAQLMLVPGWFGINTTICALALGFFNVVAHLAPDPPPNPLNLTYASTAAFLFILAVGGSVQRLRRTSFLAQARLRDAVFQLNELATRDHLTGCANRRHFYELAESELARSRRYRRDLSLVLIDLDHFKSINDRFGHAAGDVVLNELAGTVRSRLRELDTLGRIGGEEFALLLPETSSEEARAMAERLRRMIESTIIPRDEADLRVTASFGVTQRHTGEVDIDVLMRRADFALYEAKRQGRNRVVVRDDGDEAPRPGTNARPGEGAEA